MGETPESRSSTTKGHWRGIQMFKRESSSSKYTQMGAVASKDYGGEGGVPVCANKKKRNK